MKKIIAFENVTLDSYMAGPNGELDWAIHDDEMSEFTQQGESTIDTFLFGRVTYEMMASFWPTPAGEEANPFYANTLNKTNKIVFSKTLKNADWENTEIMRDLSKDVIIKLKQQPGKNIMIFGSGSLITQLTNLGLIDEFQLMLNPVILGTGKPLFKDIEHRTGLVLKKTKAFTNRVVYLQYSPIPHPKI